MVDRDEPLFGGAEDDRLFTAPAVGVGVLDEFQFQERPVGLHLFGDQFVGLVVILAFDEVGDAVVEMTLAVDRHNDRQFIF